MRRRRWPGGAETQRKDAISAIRQIRELADEARRLTKTNPALVELQLADIQRHAADAERLLVLAKLGEREDDL